MNPTGATPQTDRLALLGLLDLPDISMAVLSGPAGSGKTTLTAAFIREASLRGLSLAITAPTHKAVRVLRDTLGRTGVNSSRFPFSTLHSLLGLRLAENEDGSFSLAPGADRDLSRFDWLIVDECSMVSRELLFELASARGDCRILFVGDPHQLPPVNSDSGSVPPVFTLPAYTVSLERVHRQEEHHPVHRIARTLLDWTPVRDRPQPADLFPDPDSLYPSDFSDPRKLLWIPGGVHEVTTWAGELLRRGEDVVLLAYTNRRVELYNQILFRHEYGGISTPFARNEKVYLNETSRVKGGEGEFVVLPANEELTVEEIFPERHPDYPEIPAHRVRITDGSGLSFSLLVPDDAPAHQRRIDRIFREIRKKKEEQVSTAGDPSGKPPVPEERKVKELSRSAWALKRAFAQLRHGYSMTVFKAQGSTFDSVIIDWQDMNLFRDDRLFVRALYVAATRPRRRLLFTGSRS